MCPCCDAMKIGVALSFSGSFGDYLSTLEARKMTRSIHQIFCSTGRPVE